MEAAALLREVDLAFPPVAKPKGLDLSFHRGGCARCDFLRKELQDCNATELPAEGVRQIHQDMSCLSAMAWRWVLPSYLKHCLRANDALRDETEFLIYNLGPEPKFEEETAGRLSLLNLEQLDCLVHFLEWCAAQAYWSRYCAEDIALAITFLRTLKAGR
jgi:hypothetical protein